MVYIIWKTQCFTSFIASPNLNNINNPTTGDEIHEISVRSVEECGRFTVKYFVEPWCWKQDFTNVMDDFLGVVSIVGYWIIFGSSSSSSSSEWYLWRNNRRMEGVRKEDQVLLPLPIMTETGNKNSKKISGICSPEKMLNEVKQFAGEGWCKPLYSQGEKSLYLCLNGQETPDYETECGTIQTMFMVPKVLILFIMWFLFTSMLKKTGVYHYCKIDVFKCFKVKEQETSEDEATPLTNDE